MVVEDVLPPVLGVHANCCPLDPRLRVALRSSLVGPRQGHHGLERKRPRSLVHFRARRRVTIPPEARHGPDLQSPPGRRRRLRILLEAPARDVIQRAQLLRRVRQRGRHDERRRESAVLLPGMFLRLPGCDLTARANLALPRFSSLPRKSKSTSIAPYRAAKAPDLDTSPSVEEEYHANLLIFVSL